MRLVNHEWNSICESRLNTCFENIEMRILDAETTITVVIVKKHLLDDNMEMIRNIREMFVAEQDRPNCEAKSDSFAVVGGKEKYKAEKKSGFSSFLMKVLPFRRQTTKLEDFEGRTNSPYFPPEVLEKILFYVGYDDLSKMREVNSVWKSISEGFLNKGFEDIEMKIINAETIMKRSASRNPKSKKYHKSVIMFDLEFALISLLDFYEQEMAGRGLYFGKILDEMEELLVELTRKSADINKCDLLIDSIENLSKRAIGHFDKLRWMYKISYTDQKNNPKKENVNDVEYESFDIDEDENAQALSINPNLSLEGTLTPTIMDKITGDGILPSDDPIVVEAFAKVGRKLSTYKSGKLPKLLKIVPTLSNCDEILFLTRPELYSAEAVKKIIRIFSNFQSRDITMFYRIIRSQLMTSIEGFDALNIHHDETYGLCKDLQKPAAFFVKCLMYLKDRKCCLTEAVVINTVLSGSSFLEVSMSILPKKEYNFAVSFFLWTLMKMKFELHDQVIDLIVPSILSPQFCSKAGKRNMPIIWHQGLLAFLQLYKDRMIVSHKEMLEILIKAYVHHQLTPEISKELRSCQTNKLAVERLRLHHFEKISYYDILLCWFFFKCQGLYRYIREELVVKVTGILYLIFG
ncbi:hypothetical protein CHUAL_012134 [Chamberlinius hualienensis]